MTVWYVARGAGLSALLLLTVTTCLGAIMSHRSGASGRVVLQYVHRATAALGLGALVLHLTTILADSYAHVGWLGALVPFTAGYRPVWVGLGTLAVYTFVLVAAIGFARARFAAAPAAARAWRWLHGLAYLGWGAALLHGINAGSDGSVGWVRWLYVACVGAVAGAVTLRVLASRTDEIRTPAAVAS
jgi:hypothetical protein